MIYLDNAATTALHESVQSECFRLSVPTSAIRGNVHGGAYGAACRDECSRATVAECLGCTPRQIVLLLAVPKPTIRHWQQGLNLAAGAHRMRMVASSIEHPAVLRALDYWEAQGFVITLVNPDETGVVSARAIRPFSMAMCLVSVMTARTMKQAFLQPVAEIAQVAHAAGSLSATDAVQAAGHVRLDAEALGGSICCRFRRTSSMAPKGSARWYAVRARAPTYRVRRRSKRGRSGTENVPGIVNLAGARRSVRNRGRECNSRAWFCAIALKSSLNKSRVHMS